MLISVSSIGLRNIHRREDIERRRETAVEGKVVRIVITGTGTIRIQQMIAIIVNIPEVTRGGHNMNLIKHQRLLDIKVVMKVN